MRKICLILLVGLVIGICEGSVSSSSLREFCSQSKKCSITASVPTSLPTDVATTTQHEMVKFNFVYFTNVSYETDATDQQSDNMIGLSIVINNVKSDPCDEANCWMRIRQTTDYPFVDPSLSGYYDYENNTLSLYPQFAFGFPSHDKTTDYTVSFETCIINPLIQYNDCTDNLDDKSLHKGQKLINIFKKRY